MTLDKAYELLNFYVNKYQGAYFSPGELDLVVDRAQRTLFNSYYVKYASSQRLDDALAVFKAILQFSNVTTPGGALSIPADYLNLLAIHTIVQDANGITRNRPVQLVTEDELVYRLNSQIVPASTYDPVAILQGGTAIEEGTAILQLYPKEPTAGLMTYLRQPVAPFFSYSVISGRVIVYNPSTSIQLEWSDKDIVSILLLALNMLGINISEQDIIQYSEVKNQQNLNTNFKQ